MFTPNELVPELTPFVEGRGWAARAPLRFIGIPMGCRMTLCRLADGRLFLHSPMELAFIKEDLLEKNGKEVFRRAFSFCL